MALRNGGPEKRRELRNVTHKHGMIRSDFFGPVVSNIYHPASRSRMLIPMESYLLGGLKLPISLVSEHVQISLPWLTHPSTRRCIHHKSEKKPFGYSYFTILYQLYQPLTIVTLDKVAYLP